MKQYHKIETLFSRDMLGDKQLIEGKFRNPLVEYIKDCEWIFTEKIDGTNVRVHWDGHEVSFGGRTDNAQMPMPLMERLQFLFLGNENEELFEQTFQGDDVTFYGEGFGGKIQKGSGYRPTQDFILFDVMVGDTFLERGDIEDIAKSFKLEVVPILLRGTIEEAIFYVKTYKKSLVAFEEREMEGLVGVPSVRMNDHRGNRVIVKVKVRDFTK